MRDEVLDVLHSLGGFQNAIRNGKNPPARIAKLGRELQAEIDEAIEQYRREWEAREVLHGCMPRQNEQLAQEQMPRDVAGRVVHN